MFGACQELMRGLYELFGSFSSQQAMPNTRNLYCLLCDSCLMWQILITWRLGELRGQTEQV